jgi:hypothetical protein
MAQTGRAERLLPRLAELGIGQAPALRDRSVIAPGASS